VLWVGKSKTQEERRHNPVCLWSALIAQKLIDTVPNRSGFRSLHEWTLLMTVQVVLEQRIWEVRCAWLEG